MAQTPPRSGAWASSDHAIPVKTGRYECLERIGHGGMGVVWRARDSQLNRDVAYKTITLDAPEEVRERLLQEAKLAAHLRQSGVVTVYDQGISDDERPYYVMELLEFPLLGRSKDEDLRSLLQVAETLGEVHSLGLVHRDLKPSNLARREDTAVIADWGLARPIGDESHWDRSVLTGGRAMTRTGVAMGSAGYMAPEQLTGGVCNPRVDVWSLAAMLAEVLTGDTPYADDGSHRLLAEVVGGTLALPPGPLSEVARRGLRVDPSERYEDGRRFAEAMAAAMPTDQRRPSRQRGMPALLALGVGTTAALAAWTASPNHAADAAEAFAEQAWMLHERGRTLEARALALRSRDLVGSPLASGMLTMVATEPLVPTAFPTDCDRITLDSRQNLGLCQRATKLGLYDMDGAKKWERELDEVRSYRVEDGVSFVFQEWSVLVVDADGSARHERRAINVEDFGELDGELLIKSGPQVRLLGDTDPLATTVSSMGPVTAGGLLLVEKGGTLSAWSREAGLRQVPPFAEPLIGWRVADDHVTLVGLRGLVLVLDGASFEEVERYRLRESHQVGAAAVAPNGDIAVSTTRGVFVHRGTVGSRQISTEPARALSFGRDNTLLAVAANTVYTWTDPERSRTVAKIEGSTTMLHSVAGADLYVGTQEGTLWRVHTDLLEEQLQDELGGALHDMATLRDTAVIGADSGIWLLGRKRTKLLNHPVVAALGDGTIIAAKRWGSGVTWLTDAGEHHRSDAPHIRDLIEDVDGVHVIGRDIDGDLWRLDASHTIESLGISGVHAVESTPWGLLLGKTRAVSLGEAWTAELPDRVTTVVAGPRFVAAGTLTGEVYVWTPAGDLVAQIRAHGERVSAMEFVGDRLYTGSWQPGVRRWDIGLVETR